MTRGPLRKVGTRPSSSSIFRASRRSAAGVPDQEISATAFQNEGWSA